MQSGNRWRLRYFCFLVFLSSGHVPSNLQALLSQVQFCLSPDYIKIHLGTVRMDIGQSSDSDVFGLGWERSIFLYLTLLALSRHFSSPLSGPIFLHNIHHDLILCCVISICLQHILPSSHRKEVLWGHGCVCFVLLCFPSQWHARAQTQDEGAIYRVDAPYSLSEKAKTKTKLDKREEIKTI